MIGLSLGFTASAKTRSTGHWNNPSRIFESQIILERSIIELHREIHLASPFLFIAGVRSEDPQATNSATTDSLQIFLEFS